MLCVGQQEAKQLFKDLKEQGIQPSPATYGAYTNAMASSGTANIFLELPSGSGRVYGGASSARTSLQVRNRALTQPTKHEKQASRSRSLVLINTDNKPVITRSSFTTINETQEITFLNGSKKVEFCLQIFFFFLFVQKKKKKTKLQ
ncbi:hypothetical protein RFI_18369 [Reticulomyxa filosa]|uniref:Uncharacterized protein n=1 Tax=Reticulomyxa filosa TaxID=46433 RepID=X6MYL2_RETFI|nr:hypothetical protein RFI_18369 [Reticulomyxa filosa]|eukprot:ETO18876.1 hypothetical protein RFI_18369 [Reticulomyxa filosa]